MSLKKMPALRIGDWEADIPIVQGGMGVGISLSGLVSAVANAGGIGVIAAAGVGMFEPDQFTHFKEANKRGFQKEIRKTKAKTDGIIGANIMNICWVAGASSIANPLIISRKEIMFMFPAMFVIVGSMLALIRYKYSLTRTKGFILLGLYLIYLYLVIFIMKFPLHG